MTEPLIITTTPVESHQLDMTIQFGPERTEEALQRGARLVSKRAKIPGFRPGKAPNATVLRMFGRKAVLAEVLDDMAENIVKEALDATPVDLYGKPELLDVEADPPTFKLRLALRPVVELGDYQAIRVARQPVNVTDADVEAVIEKERRERVVSQPVSRPAAIGDSVLVDIKGTIGETTIMDNQNWELGLRAEGGWLPGFDEAFVGLSAGESKTFTLTYPEDSASRYRGQQVTFEVHVKEVRAKVPPELSDDFARSLGEFADLADLRAKLRERMTAQAEDDAENRFRSAVIEALVAGATIVYPPQAVDDVVDEMLREMEREVKKAGYGLEEYLRLQGRTLERYRAEIRPAAERRLKSRLALRQLAQREALTVTDEEVMAEVERLCQLVPEDQQADFRKTLTSPAGQTFLRQDLLTERAIAKLQEIASQP